MNCTRARWHHRTCWAGNARQCAAMETDIGEGTSREEHPDSIGDVEYEAPANWFKLQLDQQE